MFVRHRSTGEVVFKADEPKRRSGVCGIEEYRKKRRVSGTEKRKRRGD